VIRAALLKKLLKIPDDFDAALAALLVLEEFRKQVKNPKSFETSLLLLKLIGGSSLVSTEACTDHLSDNFYKESGLRQKSLYRYLTILEETGMIVKKKYPVDNYKTYQLTEEGILVWRAS
jgi:DNA-binding transcriptional ArsR family regulator